MRLPFLSSGIAALCTAGSFIAAPAHADSASLAGSRGATLPGAAGPLARDGGRSSNRSGGALILCLRMAFVSGKLSTGIH